jgi:hypothetical protein
MRHIDVVGEVFRECGRATLRGLSCCLSVINFFAARTSHIGSESEVESSGEVESVTRRFFVVEETSFRSEEVLMCFRSALDARSVYPRSAGSQIWKEVRNHLIFV